MSESSSTPLPKHRINNITNEIAPCDRSVADNSIQACSDSDLTYMNDGLIPKPVDCDGKIARGKLSISSLSLVSSMSESSLSLELESSLDQLSDISTEAIDVTKAKTTAVKKDETKTSQAVRKPRMWSYIKIPMKIFRKGAAEAIGEDTDSDLPIYMDCVDIACSYGTTTLIKKLTNLYMMMGDPEVGLVKQTSKSINSFSGEELYKWILDNFQSNEDDFLSFLSSRTEIDEIDALTICKILFLAGFIVSLDKECSKFGLNNSGYILQAPYFIPLANCVPSDSEYARYLIRRENSKKFKLQDYELKSLEELKLKLKSSWKGLRHLAEKDTAAFRRRSKDDINIFKLQQQTFWRIYRPGPDLYDILNLSDDAIKRIRRIESPTKSKDSIKQPRLKIGKACKYLKDYCMAVSFIDPFLQNSSSNPWICGDTTIWDNEPAVSDSQIYLWTTGIYYLLNDSRGIKEFNSYLKKEFSQENLHFILACRELEKKVTLKDFSILAKQIYQDFIMAGSPFEINIVSSIRNNLIAVLEPLIKNGNELESEHYDIYSDAINHILILLEKDPYKRYCKLLRSKLPHEVNFSRKSLSRSQRNLSSSTAGTVMSTNSLRIQKGSGSNLKFDRKKSKNIFISTFSLRNL